jgi:hypothetical protein
MLFCLHKFAKGNWRREIIRLTQSSRLILCVSLSEGYVVVGLMQMSWSLKFLLVWFDLRNIKSDMFRRVNLHNSRYLQDVLSSSTPPLLPKRVNSLTPQIPNN